MLRLVVVSLLLLVAQVTCQCPAPFMQCKSQCDAKGDSLEECSAKPVDGVCVSTIKCICDSVFARCKSTCTDGVDSCSCDKGVDSIVCAGGGLGDGAIAGIAIVCSLLYCVLCGVGLYFLWKNLPDAEDEDDEEQQQQQQHEPEPRRSSTPAPAKPPHKTATSERQTEQMSYAKPQEAQDDEQYHYSARPPAKHVRDNYVTPQNMANDVDDEYQAGGYGGLPLPVVVDKKKAAAEAARKRAADAVASRSASSAAAAASDADEDLKRRRAEILRKKKEELLRKKAEAEAQLDDQGW